MPALKALMPKLTGKWLCDIGADEHRDVYAVIARNGWKRWQFFIVLREYATLCLLVSSWPPGSELVAHYDGIEQLTGAIHDIAGRSDDIRPVD
jgi:hypothetical protein